MGTDIDDRQQLSSIAYLFLSLAIQNNQSDINLVLTRLLVMLNNREALAYIIHSGFISGYQNRYGDNLKPPTNVYHRMTA